MVFIYIFMKEKTEKFKSVFLNFSSRLISVYKYYLLVFFVLFLIGFLTGLITASGYSKDLTCDNLINPYMLDFLKKEMTFFSYFLTVGIIFLLLCILTMLLVRNKLLIVLNAIIMMIFAYIFGFDLCVIIVCLGLAGVVCGIFFWGIPWLLIFVIYLIIMSIQAKRVICKDVCAKYSKEFCKLIWMLAGCALVMMLVSILLFSIIHIFIIVE